MFRRSLFPLCVLLIAGSAAAATLPANGDDWTEYASASEAIADGWVRECGLSQIITVDADCMTGSSSAGCRATQASWCDEFGLEKTASLVDVTALYFRHKASWAGLNFSVRLYMQPTVDEAAAGVEIKRVSWNFPSATTWTEHDLAIADGEWSWRVNNMWVMSGHEETLTEMVGIKWFFCAYWGIAVGDRMLIDELHLTLDVSAVPPVSAGIRFAGPYPNPFNPTTELCFSLERSTTLSLVIYDLAGRRQRVLAEHEFDAGPHAVTWDGRDDRGRLLPAGVYQASLEGAGLRLVRKVAMIK